MENVYCCLCHALVKVTEIVKNRLPVKMRCDACILESAATFDHRILCVFPHRALRLEKE